MNTSIDTSVDAAGDLVIMVSGSLADGGAVALSEAVSAAVDQLQPDVVHVDLGLVTCVDLVGAAALTQARRSASNCGTRVVLRNPTAAVARSLQVTDAFE